LCEREAVLTRHHLIPRARHHNRRNKREFARSTVRAVVGLCRSCHSQVHQLLTEKQLEREFNTVEKLRAHPGVATFAEWMRPRPSGFRPAMRSSRS
jgi:5-methylcytosine-specific restriction endonuclease McrA